MVACIIGRPSFCLLDSIKLVMAGHTTMTCPHRVATEHGVIPARKNKRNSLDYVFERQLRTGIPTVSFDFTVLGFSSPLSLSLSKTKYCDTMYIALTPAGPVQVQLQYALIMLSL